MDPGADPSAIAPRSETAFPPRRLKRDAGAVKANMANIAIEPKARRTIFFTDRKPIRVGRVEELGCVIIFDYHFEKFSCNMGTFGTRLLDGCVLF
jgi:hypothetical protein